MTDQSELSLRLTDQSQVSDSARHSLPCPGWRIQSGDVKEGKKKENDDEDDDDDNDDDNDDEDEDEDDDDDDIDDDDVIEGIRAGWLLPGRHLKHQVKD